VQPYHCTDSAGRDAVCGGESVWEPNEAAVIDYRTLKYEAFLALIASAFFALIVDRIGRSLPVAISRIMVFRAGLRTLKDK
jgi:hypothetical protein